MIQNIIFFLVANTLAPYLFVPPAILSPLPLLQHFIEPPTVLENMNIPRLYTSQQFRKAFKDSLRVHHPDHGGQQDVFQQIQGLKKIMSRDINYYDLYNLTDSDVSSTNMKLDDIVELKKYTYYVQTGIFYFIAFLYILAFTLDNDSKTSRKVMLTLTLSFLLYELYMHQYPKSVTIIDLIYNKIPLFTQRKYLKRSLIIWIALIRCFYFKKRTEEDVLLQQLEQQRPPTQYRDILQRLKAINQQKFNQKKKYEAGWMFKIRNWISKGISVLFLLILIKSLIPGLNLL